MTSQSRKQKGSITRVSIFVSKLGSSNFPRSRSPRHRTHLLYSLSYTPNRLIPLSSWFSHFIKNYASHSVSVHSLVEPHVHWYYISIQNTPIRSTTTRECQHTHPQIHRYPPGQPPISHPTPKMKYSPRVRVDYLMGLTAQAQQT